MDVGAKDEGVRGGKRIGHKQSIKIYSVLVSCALSCSLYGIDKESIKDHTKNQIKCITKLGVDETDWHLYDHSFCFGGSSFDWVVFRTFN
jgi:hypothetical protein